MFFFFLPNWFLCTDTANDDILIALCSCGIPPNNFSVMPECVRNLHHISQLPYCLDAVVLEMPLDVYRLPIVMIPSR